MKTVQIQRHQYSIRILFDVEHCLLMYRYTGLWIFALSSVSMFHHHLFAKTCGFNNTHFHMQNAKCVYVKRIYANIIHICEINGYNDRLVTNSLVTFNILLLLLSLFISR